MEEPHGRSLAYCGAGGSSSCKRKSRESKKSRKTRILDFLDFLSILTQRYPTLFLHPLYSLRQQTLQQLRHP